MEYPMSLLVDKFRQLRDKKKLISDRHEKELEPIKQAMGALENIMLDQLNRAGGNSMATDHGTAYKSVRTTVTVSDPATFRDWVEANNCPEFYENRVSKEAIESYIAQGHNLPPGISVSSFTTVNVRK